MVYWIISNGNFNCRYRGNIIVAHQLKGKRNFYRIKSSDYRIVYTIDDDVLLVTVIKVRKRGEVYLKLDRL